VNTARVYKDVTGKPCSLWWLVKHEPEWAVNQIEHRDKLDVELQSAKARIEALEMALLPFAQIGDIANDPDCTVWKRSVSAGSVRLARGVLEAKDSK